jgi:hypothetical protein
MTNDETENCQFIPKISEKSRDIMKRHTTEEEGKKPPTFEERFGLNFTKSDPSIYKKGILKKSWRLYHEGNYKMAMTTLEAGFNIKNIKDYFTPKFYMKKVAEAL